MPRPRQSRIPEFVKLSEQEEKVEARPNEGSTAAPNEGQRARITVPSLLIEDLARELRAPSTIIEILVNWMFNYLNKYWSVGFDRLVFDLAAARDEEVQFALEVLGIEIKERKITDDGIARLRVVVRKIIEYLEKAGLVEYVRDLGVVNLVKGNNA